ncbi:MAG: mechanosensitive ion channel family protein [Micrococcales bacterium]|nr:mechanosensitive ion channel family protein [Micrococcales bacterium]
MEYLATPQFAANWPEWARWLIGDPLAIVLYLIGALVVLAIAHVVIRRMVAKAANAPSKSISGIGSQNPQYAAARRDARVKTIGSVAHSTVKALVWILTAALIMERLGVKWHVIMAVLGLLAVGVGLGAQSLVKDMIAGVFMIAEDQFGIGDYIDADVATGQVVSVNLRVTTLKDDDGVMWYIPNGTISRVGNKSQKTRTE